MNSIGENGEGSSGDVCLNDRFIVYECIGMASMCRGEEKGD